MKTRTIILVIITAVVSIIATYKAGVSYNKGYIDGYRAASQNHRAASDSLSTEYKVAIKEYEEAKYWCNKVRDLYNEKLDSLNISQDND